MCLCICHACWVLLNRREHEAGLTYGWGWPDMSASPQLYVLVLFQVSKGHMEVVAWLTPRQVSCCLVRKQTAPHKLGTRTYLLSQRNFSQAVSFLSWFIFQIISTSSHTWSTCWRVLWGNRPPPSCHPFYACVNLSQNMHLKMQGIFKLKLSAAIFFSRNVIL